MVQLDLADMDKAFERADGELTEEHDDEWPDGLEDVHESWKGIMNKMVRDKRQFHHTKWKVRIGPDVDVH